MPHSHGYRKGTRYTFARPFRQSGPILLSKYLTTYRLGDHVDIKVNGSIHKGMPYKFYHGKTGVVWNVTKSAVGVEVNKQVRNRIIKKRFHVRVEHVQPSRCKEDFLRRVKANEAAKKEAAKTNTRSKVNTLKRLPGQPKPGKIIKVHISKAETFTPIKYEHLF
eukprot:TRINITY_DN130_c0_g1_i1.p1 TRINITY_DN130_c0_g1~~TRINITY_DN130_c0_g1_i1.p1  ORF type:complete len:164 (+),score=27.23 TRINITY_DN130_c0_g1_i1:69-560(+)